MDSFTYGKAARQRPSVGRKPLYVVLAVLVGAGAVVAAFALIETGGDAVVRHVKTVTKAAESAGDLQAQSNLRLALQTAKTTLLDDSSYGSAGSGQLSLLDPSLTYVEATQPSTGPDVVSVEAGHGAWGAALLSSSGTCFYVRDVLPGGTAYGTGDVCTGEAAMGATASSFPAAPASASPAAPSGY
jgi:hypothetical protein